MRKFIYLFPVFISFIIFSCQDNIDNEIDNGKTTPNKEFVNFSNIEDFLRTINYLENLNLRELKSWSKEKMDESYFDLPDFPDATLANIPYNYRAILNKNLEFKINDSVFWFNNHSIYFLTDKDYSIECINKLKSDPSNLDVFINFGLNEFDQSPMKKSVNLDLNSKYNLGEKILKLTPSQVIKTKAGVSNYKGSSTLKFVASLAFNRVSAQWGSDYKGEVNILLYELINDKYVEVKDPAIDFIITNKPWYLYMYTVLYCVGTDLILGPDWFPAGGTPIYSNKYPPKTYSNNFKPTEYFPSITFYGTPIVIFRTNENLPYNPNGIYNKDNNKPISYGITNLRMKLDQTTVTIFNIDGTVVDDVSLTFKKDL